MGNRLQGMPEAPFQAVNTMEKGFGERQAQDASTRDVANSIVDTDPTELRHLYKQAQDLRLALQ